MNTSVNEMIAGYLRAWNKSTKADFEKEFATCWAPGATYTDPNNDNLEGLEGIVSLAVGSEEKYPGRQFSLVTEPETHHNVLRYTWKVNFPGMEREGQDFIEFNEQFLITRLVSFFPTL